MTDEPDEVIAQCFAYSRAGQRCTLEPHLPYVDHAFTITWTDDECWTPDVPMFGLTYEEYVAQLGKASDALVIPEQPHLEVVYPDPPETDEEREAREQREAEFERAIEEAGGEDDDAGLEDVGAAPAAEITPAAMPKRRRKTPPKCFACGGHPWHTSECQQMVGEGEHKTVCGCTTAVS